jgi:UBX domain-containing protein 7
LSRLSSDFKSSTTALSFATMDAAIAQIVTITSASPERAAQYLQLADGDLDSAVMLYFESNGADPSGGTSSSSAPPPPAAVRTGPTGDAQDPIDIDDENISDDNDPEITGFRKVNDSEGPAQSHNAGSTFDADAEYARRLQEQMYGGAAGQEQAVDGEVRAPIARQSETLLGPGADVGPLDERDIPAHVMQQMHRMQDRRTHQGEWYSRPRMTISDFDSPTWYFQSETCYLCYMG